MAEGVINVTLDASDICTMRQKHVRKRVQNILVYFDRVKNTVRLDKTLQLHQPIRCDMCNAANIFDTYFRRGEYKR